MPGMKVTVSAAMRARDVSRPQPHHEAAAEQNSPPARPRAKAAPRLTGNNVPGQAAAPIPPPAPRHRPTPPGPRPGGATPPERGKVPRPGGATPPRPGNVPRPGGATPPERGKVPRPDARTPPGPGNVPRPGGATPPGPGKLWRPDGATPPERGKVPRPDGRTARPAAAPAREPGQQEPAPGREVPGARRPGEPRDPRGSVTAKTSERPAGDAGSEPTARARPAKRKRVRRRRSHGR
jgi:translation initiation factor IF-2